MLRSLWLHKLLKLSRSRKDRRRQAAQARRGVRPHLESLEERITPAGGLPYATAATAAQLAADITTVNANLNQSYTIKLAANAPASAFQLSSALNITNPAGVTIQGNGDTLTAAANDRAFLIGSGANVILQNLTITGGNVKGSAEGVKGGGAIRDGGGTVALSKVVVEGNKVSGSIAEGGGIFVAGGSKLTIAGGSVIETNQALGVQASAAGTGGGSAFGGGVYISGSSTVQISDSTLLNNSAQGGAGAAGAAAAVNGGDGGDAFGGGVYVSGDGWTVTLIGDTLSGNSATGGNGGNGAAGSNASGTNASGGNGGNGGNGGAAEGGAASFAGNGTSLTILDDPNAPTANPALLIDNSAQAGSGGNGGAGGTSTGTANNSNGGNAGVASSGEGGAVFLTAPGATVNIGNTTFYGNSAVGTNGGVGGAAGTGGSGKAGTAGSDTAGGYGVGGGLDFRNGFFTMVNSTVANNSATAGFAQGGAGPRAVTYGGGIADNDSATNSPASVIFDNNTITRNTITGGTNLGAGLSLDPLALSPTLLNNLIAGNNGIGSPFADLEITNGQTQDNAYNNFIGSIDDPGGSVSTTSNFIGNTQTQLGGVVGVTANGKPSGGPIYFPLLPSTRSVQGGSTDALGDIGNVEGNPATLTDEIGNPRSANGNMDIGAVQFMAASTTVSFTNWTLSTPSPLAASSLPLKEKISTQVENSLGAFINGGTVKFSLIAPNKTVVTSSPPESVSTTGNGLVNGSLTMPANLLIGAYTIQAVYTTTAGQALTNSPGSTSLIVNQAPTTTTLNSIPLVKTSPNDQSVSVTANVASVNGPNGVANEGTVTFTLYDSNNVQIGNSVQASVSSTGKATASVTVPGGSAAGNYTVQAVYTDPANSDFLTSSTTTPLHVGPAPATVSLANVTPATLFTGPNAQNVTAVANVTSTSTVNEGTVTFELLLNGKVDKSVPPVVVNVVNGQAALTSSNPLVIPGNTAAGTYTLQAAYSDAGNYFSAPTPATATLTIQQSTATLALVNVAPANLFTSPTTQNVTADVNVTSAQGTVNEGTVTLEWIAGGGTTISSVTANVSNGQAQFTAANPLVIPAAEAAGTYTLKAVYSDPTNNFIASSTSQSLTIQQSSAKVALANVTPTSLFTNANDQNVTATANVTSGNGTVNEGTVTFELLEGGTVDSAVSPVTVNVVNNQAILTSANPLVIPGGTAVGTYTLQAAYSDASNVFVAATPATTTLTMTQSTSSVTLTNLSSTNLFTSPNVQNVTTTVDVTSNAGTVNEGKVTFALLQSGTTIGSVTANVANGQAQFTNSNPLAIPAAEAAATYTLKASYSDAAGNFVSASFSQSLTITQSTANVTLSNVTPTSLFTNVNDQNVTATANVTSSSGTVNEGTVTFELLQGGTVDSAVSPVTVNVVNGQASLTSANPLVIPGGTAAGTYTLQAAYSDASNVFLAATPATTTLTMTQSTSSVTLTNLSSTNLFTNPTTQNVTATVDVASNAGTVNEGKVTFALLQSGTTISSVTASVTNGQAQFDVNNPLIIPAAKAAGTYTLKASYSDAAGNFVSASFSQSLTITQSTANVALSNVTPTSLFTNANDQNVTADAVVSSGQGTVNEGTVTFELLQNGKEDKAVSPVTVNVVNGQASLTSANPLVIPGGTAVGTYTLQAAYNDASNVFLAAAPATTKLTITKSTNNVTLTNLSPTNLFTSPTTQNVTATVDVASNAGTVNEGTVTFALLQGSTAISSVTANVSNGQAQFDANNPLVIPVGQAAGTYTLQATYNDPAGNFVSASFSQSLTIQQSSANVALSNVTPANLFTNPNAQNVTAEVVIASGQGTVNEGTVTFTLFQNGTVDSAVSPVTVNVVNGQASLTSANPLVIPGGTAVGTYTLQAAYSDASNVFLAAAPATTTLTMTQSTSSVTLTNLSPTNLFTSPTTQNVTATVDVTSNAGTVNEGTVTLEWFASGGTTPISSATANVTNGQAQFDVNNPLIIPANEVPGTYVLQAIYSDPAGNFVTASFNQTLTLAQSTANVVVGGVGPIDASPSDQTVNVSATILNANATVNEGTVTFALFDSNNVQVGAAVTANVLSGTANASLTVPGDTSGGSYTLKASYTDKSGVFVAASPTTATLTIRTQTATVALGSVGPITARPLDQAVNVSASVLNSNVTVNQGIVVFVLLDSNNVQIGAPMQANVSNGTANVSLHVPSGTPAGSYSIQASYLDKSGVFLATPPAPATLTINLASVSVSVGSVTALTASSANQSVSVSATVASPNDAVNQGTVTFALFNGGNVRIGAAVQVNVSNGTAHASLTVPGGTAAGDYRIEAVYTDSQGVFAGSSGNGSLSVQSAPVPSPLQAALTIAFDTAALLLQTDSAALSLLTIVSQRFLGQPLPPVAELLPTIEVNFRYAGDLGIVALEAGVSIADSITGAKPASSTPSK